MGYWNSRCCSYTVRCYDADGATLWVQDYFRGATADSDPDTTLSVAVLGDVVYVAGPRMESAAAAGVYFNCVTFSRLTGGLLARYDLWVSGQSYDAIQNGDIEDICAGLDGSIGVLFWSAGGVGSSQTFGRYDASTLAELPGRDIIVVTFLPSPSITIESRSVIGYHSAGFPFDRIEVDVDSVIHFGGENIAGRSSIAVDSTNEYRCGGVLNPPDSLIEWWEANGFVGQTSFYATGDYPPYQVHPFGEFRGDWFSLVQRAPAGLGLSPDDGSIMADLSVMRDSLGAATGIVVIGPGQVRGDVATAAVTSGYDVFATSGNIAETGIVGRFDLSGTFTKTYTPTGGRTSWGRVAAVQGAGYVLGAGRTVDLPTLMMCSAADAKSWAHKHQSLTDVVSTSAGGCVTVGARSHQDSTESNFI